MSLLTSPHNSSTALTLVQGSELSLPSLITNAGPETAHRFVEFFLVNIRNPNTREAYARAIKQFLDWCSDRHIQFSEISSLAISAYIERHPGSAPTTNQHLAAIRALFGWMVTGGILQTNPAAEVKGLKHRVKIGKTSVLTDAEMRELLNSIDVSHVIGSKAEASQSQQGHPSLGRATYQATGFAGGV